MSHTNLADTRLLTIDDAKATLEALAHAECRVQSVAAAGEKKIAKIKSECQTATAADQALINVMKARLTAFILGNRALFKDKRTMKTDFGTFGLRAANNKLAVTNEEQAIAHANAKGFTDLVETVERLVLDAVKTRIKAGETIPGCSLPTGEQAFYTIAKAILEAADKAE